MYKICNFYCTVVQHLLILLDFLHVYLVLALYLPFVHCTGCAQHQVGIVYPEKDICLYVVHSITLFIPVIVSGLSNGIVHPFTSLTFTHLHSHLSYTTRITSISVPTKLSSIIFHHHASPRTTTHYHALPCSTMHHHASPRLTTQHHAAPRSTTQHHAALRSTTQHHAAPCFTTQHHAPPRTTTQIIILVPGQFTAALYVAHYPQ